MMIAALVILILIAGLLFYLLRGGARLPAETDAIIQRVMRGDLPELVTGETGHATSHGLKIWYERLEPTGAVRGTLLLNMGSGGSAIEWTPGFLRTFTDAGYQVIRYDYRGTGLSDWVKNWSRKNPYTVADMADDALAVLDALYIEQTHVLGLSMGGMIAQAMAIKQPHRIRSLILLMTSGDIGDPDVPSLSSRYFLGALLKGLPLLRYRLVGGEKNLIKERVAKLISFAGSDNLHIEETAETVLYDLRKRRGLNLKAVFQHQTAVTISGSRYEQLKSLPIPALVIHGTADQLIPVEHGKKLVAVLPDATGLWLDGVGHGWPVPNMDRVNDAILAHLNTHEHP